MSDLKKIPSSDVADSESWFDNPTNIQRIIGVLIGICVLLVLAEFTYTNPHPHFPIESSFAFQAWLGFVAFVVIVFLGRGLRFLIQRPENYYEDESVDD